MKKLHELTALGRTVDPEGAVAVGFLDRLSPSDDLFAVALENAHGIAALSDAAYQETVASVWGDSLKRITTLMEAQAERLAAARASTA